MASRKKQLTIRGTFRRKARQIIPDEECDELEHEMEKLRRKAAALQTEVFEAERLDLRLTQPPAPPATALFLTQPTDDTEMIVYESEKQKLERQIKMMAMMTGAEVAVYEREVQCCVLFHMQHDVPHPLQHGLRIDLSSDTNVVTKCSLPRLFNFDAVMSEHANLMHPACLGAFRRSLVAFYDRQRQYEALEALLKHDVRLERVADKSHIKICMRLRRMHDPRDAHANPITLGVELSLDYRVYDVRAKRTTLTADLSEEEMSVLGKQCSLFKKKAMAIAFKECFMDGRGPWELYILKDENELSPHKEIRNTEKQPQRRPAAMGSDDDTWLPEDDY